MDRGAWWATVNKHTHTHTHTHTHINVVFLGKKIFIQVESQTPDVFNILEARFCDYSFTLYIQIY